MMKKHILVISVMLAVAIVLGGCATRGDLEEVEARGPGIFIVGLDSHVAFLVVGEPGIRFIHSSGANPWCVVDESRDEATTLRLSRYRVAGNLTANQEVLEGWLLGRPFKTRGL